MAGWEGSGGNPVPGTSVTLIKVLSPACEPDNHPLGELGPSIALPDPGPPPHV